MKNLFSTDEIKNVLLSTLLLGFCFSFRWEGTFSLENWILAFMVALLISCMIIFCKLSFQKYIAKKLNCGVEYRVWKSGALITLVTTVASFGYLIWAAPANIEISNLRNFRIGKVKNRIHAGPYEYSLIAISGVLIYFAFAVIGKLLTNTYSGLFANKLLIIGTYMAIFNMVPFVYPHNTVPPIIAKGNLPTLEGVWIFFGSRPLWAFSMSFILISSLSFLILGTFSSLILALIGSVLLFLLWHYYIENWNLKSSTSYNHFKKNKKPYEMGKFK